MKIITQHIILTMNKLKPNTMKRVLSLLMLLVFGYFASAQSIFTPVWTGNGLDHMNIYVTSITVNGVALSPGSEIGVFDGNICVGVAVRPTVIQNYIEIRVSKDDPTTEMIDGYTIGNPISFRIWDKVSWETYTTVITNYSSGKAIFEVGATSIVALSVNLNRRPVAVLSQSQVVNEGETVTFSGANSYDPDNNPLTYSWSVTPSIPSLDLNKSTLTIITPEVTQNTQYTITLIVSDGILNSDPAFTSLYVKNVNKVPVITGQQPLQTDESKPLTLELANVTFTDPDPGQTHTLLVYPGNNYLVSGRTITPIPLFRGELTVPVRVSDGVAQSASFNLKVTVNAVNNPPAFTSQPALSAVEAVNYLYFVTASDPDGDQLTITATTLPSWLTLDNTKGNGTATLTGTPTTANIGEHQVTLSLTDGFIAAPITQSFKITVRAASSAPVLITTALKDGYEGTLYSNALELYDSDSQNIIVSLQNAPTWISLEGADVNGLATVQMTNQRGSINLKGTPPTKSAGIFSITIIFKDNENTRSKILPIRVFAPNTAPVASDVAVTTRENEQVLVVLQGTDKETPFGLLYEIVGEPQHGRLEQISARIYFYIPNKNYFGPDEFQYKVKETGTSPLEAIAKVTVNINFVNNAPVISAPQNMFSFPEGTSITVEGIGYNDELDGENAATLVLVKPYGPYFGTFNLETFTYTPNEYFYGTDIVYLVAKESGENGLMSEPLMLRFDVKMVNRVPLVSLRNVFLNEDSKVTFTPVVSDRESDIKNIEYHIILAPTHGELVIDGLTFTYTPDADWNGTDYIVFQAKDYHGDWSPDMELIITCYPVNDKPNAIQSTIDANGSKTVEIDFTALVSDIDNPDSELEIDFIVTNDQGVGTGVFPSTIVQTFEGNNMVYTYTSNHESTMDYIIYRVFDKVSSSDPQVISISNLLGTKSNAKSDVFLAKGDFLDITWGDTLTLTFTLVVGGEVLSPPELIPVNFGSLAGKVLSYELVRFAPPLVTYKGIYVAPIKTFGKPSGNATEVLFDNVSFKGRKGKKAADVESNIAGISIGNLQTKVATTIRPIANQVINENQTASVEVEYYDPDTQPAAIIWTAQTGLEGFTQKFTAVEPGKLVLEVTPPVNFFGTMIVSVSATDDLKTTATEFIVTVNAINQAPEIQMATEANFLPNNQSVVSTIIRDRETASDQLTISFVATPANGVAEMLYENGDLKITPAQGYTSNFKITVSASDGVNTTTHNLDMIYKGANAMPSLEPISSLTILEDNVTNLKITPQDADVNDNLTVTAESSNANLIDANGIGITPAVAVTGTERTITFTPLANMFGKSDITIYVSDGLRNVAQQLVVDVLPVNDAPVLSAIENQELDNDKELILSLGATDIDSYIFTFTAQSPNADLEFSVLENTLTIRVKNNYYGTTEFTVTVADDSLATHSRTIPLLVNNTSSSPVINGVPITVYPNPAKDIIYIKGIESKEATGTANVFTIQGQLIQSRSIVGGDTSSIDISSLPKGLYIMQVKVNKQLYNTRFTKQ
jgi:hypothetical protein